MDTTRGTVQVDTTIQTILTPYLVPADISHMRCVDERRSKTPDVGVQIPGALYGIIDAIKHFAHVTEEQAWEQVKQAALPFFAHIDEHHGALGCGYGKLVEQEPHTVLATESILVETRRGKIMENNGTVLTLLGDHAPIYAVINHKANTTIDAETAVPDGKGSFNFDYWAAEIFAKKLGLDPTQFADHLQEVYQRTVVRLTNGAITTFYEIR